jgi:hypothetical protein
MFKLNGSTIQLDAPFQHEGTSYSANWLRLSSPEEREALGITEEPDIVYLDQRFYDYNGQPKDLAELKITFLASLKRTAKAALDTTDWAIVRKADTGEDVPLNIQTDRDEIRAKNTQAKTLIQEANDVEALKTVIDNLFWYLHT